MLGYDVCFQLNNAGTMTANVEWRVLRCFYNPLHIAVPQKTGKRLAIAQSCKYPGETVDSLQAPESSQTRCWSSHPVAEFHTCELL